MTTTRSLAALALLALMACATPSAPERLYRTTIFAVLGHDVDSLRAWIRDVPDTHRVTVAEPRSACRITFVTARNRAIVFDLRVAGLYSRDTLTWSPDSFPNLELSGWRSASGHAIVSMRYHEAPCE